MCKNGATRIVDGNGYEMFYIPLPGVITVDGERRRLGSCGDNDYHILVDGSCWHVCHICEIWHENGRLIEPDYEATIQVARPEDFVLALNRMMKKWRWANENKDKWFGEDATKLTLAEINLSCNIRRILETMQNHRISIDEFTHRALQRDGFEKIREGEET